MAASNPPRLVMVQNPPAPGARVRFTLSHPRADTSALRGRDEALTTNQEVRRIVS